MEPGATRSIHTNNRNELNMMNTHTHTCSVYVKEKDDVKTRMGNIVKSLIKRRGGAGGRQ